jgi:hypothetical protein
MPRRSAAATAAESSAMIDRTYAIIDTGVGMTHITVVRNPAVKSGTQYVMTFEEIPSESAVLEHAPYIASLVYLYLKFGIERHPVKNVFNVIIENLPSSHAAHYIYSAIHALHIASIMSRCCGNHEIFYTTGTDDNASKFSANFFIPLTADAERLSEEIIHTPLFEERQPKILRLLRGDY